MKKVYFLLTATIQLILLLPTYSQVTLTGNSYTESFDGIGSGLPNGFFVTTTASATSVGTAATFNTTPTAWNVTNAGFKNYASADGLTASSTSTEQAASTDRALGVRQTGTSGTGGDPGAAFYFQIANTLGLENLQLTFSLQSLDITSPRTTTWLVQYGIGASPTSFVTVGTTPSPLTTGNSTFSATTVTASFGSSLDNLSQPVWIRIVTLDASTGSGARATTGIDDFTLTYAASGTSSTAVPSAGSAAAEPSTNGSFVVTLNNAAPAGGVTVTYILSGTATLNQDYTDPQNGMITIPAGSTTGNILLNVINDSEVEPVESITLQLAGAGSGYIANTNPVSINLADDDGSVLQYYSFNTCSSSLSDGFTAQSVAGAQVWGCTSFGYTSSGVQMNGYASGSQVNEDWLISPNLDLSATTYPLLAFYSRSRFYGEPLELYITNNFTGDVTTTTWTMLNGNFPAPGSDIWTWSDNIDLSDFKSPNVRIAFKYTSTNNSASQWTIDDVYLFNAVQAPAPSITAGSRLLDFRMYNAGSTSAGKPFTFWTQNVENTLVLQAPNGYELSKNNVAFAGTISFTASELNNQPVTAYARFAPVLTNAVYNGYIHFSSTALDTSAILLKGNSIPMTNTLNVVNWNIEWFGSTAPGQGADDVTLQADNVKKVMQYLDADIYAFQEVVDTALFGSMVRSAGPYKYVIADYGTAAYDPASPSFATNYATAQKLALVYDSTVASNVSARALMITSSTAITNWSNGRVPLLVTLTASKNGGTADFDFIVIHGKAGSTLSDYERRLDGADELKDTLDTYFSTNRLIILGDFNDDLDQSIYTADGTMTTVTSYDPIVRDSADSDSYASVTLPLSYAGLNSTENNAEMIDHVVVSDEVYPIYVPLSATLYNDIKSLLSISNYGSTTTDHYPVMTRYMFTSTLPVQLLDFSGTKQGRESQLQWITAGEENTRDFVVERSADGEHYQSIGSIAASGNGHGAHYTFRDEAPLNGNNFYRLRVNEEDGAYSYSNIVKLNFAAAQMFTVAPNPAVEQFTITISSTPPVMMQMTDMNGRVVKEMMLNNTVTPVSTSGLSKGVYIIRLLADDASAQKLIIK